MATVCRVPGAAAEPDSRPAAGDEAAMLSRMAQYAERYVSNLPNFICVQVTEQFESGRKADRWRKGDTLTSQLAFSEGKERRTLQFVNDKPVALRTKRWRTPLSTEGEFGQMLATPFADSSNASFDWNRWDTVQGKRVAVFDYAVDKQHSTLKLSLSDLASAIVPYHGSIFAEPETGVILRVTNITTEIPPELREEQVSTTIEYGDVTIGGNTHLLPVHASVLLKTNRNYIRNELQFRDYRKFEAESSIKY
jgi:hypothetical protein